MVRMVLAMSLVVSCTSKVETHANVGDTDVAGGDATGGDTFWGDGVDCLPVAAGCALPQECCSQRCESDVCLGPTGLCQSVGESCSASSECCSGRCELDAVGGHCVVAAVCLGAGDPCEGSVDCCSLSCMGGVCTTESLCVVATGSCTDDSECCSDDCTSDFCVLAGGGCTTLGELCSGDGGCCSGHCEDFDGSYRCTQPSVCRAEGDLCDEPADCCSGVCGAGGRCPELAECQTAGEPCTGSHECCSGLCTDPGTGTPVCQFVSGCRSIGEICMREEDCCGAICTEYASTGVLRCVKPSTPGCLYTGEVCGGASYGASNNCCPAGPDGGSQLCLPTVMGVTRCFGVGTNLQCLDDGAVCSFADECCGGFCLPDQSGDLYCGSVCVPLGETCTTSADCCSDMLCEGGTCQPNAYGCLPIGDPCDGHDDCCSGACINDFCQEPPV